MNNDLISAQVLALSHDGKSVCRVTTGTYSGRVIFVPYVVPGEEVLLTIESEKKGILAGTLKQIIRPSKDRVEPACQYFKTCGGCHLQHMTIAKQREEKLNLVRHTFENYFHVKFLSYVDFSESIPEWNYRSKISLHRKNRKIGFYKSFSNELVEIDQCAITKTEINKHILEKNNYSELAKKVNGIVLELTEQGVLEVFQTASGNYASSDEHPVGHFFQVNQIGNAILRKLVVTECDYPKITEFYAGAGNFTFELAKADKLITAIESDSTLVKLAEKIKAENEFSNINFVCSTSEDYLHRNSYSECVLLDPPRTGAKVLAETINPEHCKKIVYVSCSINTLGRDLKILTTKGFKPEKLYFIDMFPQTKHLECIATLSA